MAIGAVGTAIRNREPTGRCRHYRRRGGRKGSPRWLYAFADWHPECDQRHAVHKSQLQFRARHRTGPLPESIEHIRAGKLRPLAVTTATRLEVLPDIPTVEDFLPGYEASGWQGIGAPRNTPAEIIDKLNKEIGIGLADPKINARIVELGGTVLAGSPADFGKRVSDDVEKWAKVIKFAHIKSD